MRFLSLKALGFRLLRINNISYISRTNRHSTAFKSKSMHCYRTLFPWDNFDEFCKYIISSVEYNKGTYFTILYYYYY